MKKYITVLISILLLNPLRVANGCGFSLMPEEYRVYLFNQSALNKNELMPLFYSAEYFYSATYNWYYDDDYNGPDVYDKVEFVNAKEWKDHTTYKGTIDDIINVIYRTHVNSIIQPNDSIFNTLPFLKHVFKNYKKEYDYLVYAKKCELISENTDPWGLQTSNYTFAEDLANEAEMTLTKKQNAFLQLRYAYQLVKIDFYYPRTGMPMADVYDKYIETAKIDSWLKPSAKYYVRQNNFMGDREQQYFLVLSFDETIDKKFRCVQLFNRKNYKEILKLAKNNHERANVYVMYELQNPGRSLANLKKIAELDPANEYLPFLIAREINKLEDWLLTPELTSFAPSILEYQWDSDSLGRAIDIRSLSNKKYLNEVYLFINSALPKSKPEQIAEYHLLASNLCLLLKQKQKGLEHLVSAEENNSSKALSYQIKFNKIAIEFDGNTQLNDNIKSQLLNLEEFHRKNPDLLVNQNTALSQLYLFIGCRLMKAGDVANGILFCSKTNRPLGEIGGWNTKNYLELLLEKAEPKHYDEILALIEKKEKTNFDKFLLNRKDFISKDNYYIFRYYDTSWIQKNKILDYKSMCYVQRDMLDSALACVSKISPEYWKGHPYDLFKCFPFTSGNSTDYQSNNDFYPYNKRQYLQRMLDVKFLAENKIGDVAKHYFILANGYFNMSYHGNYWIMNMPYKLSDEVENNYYSFSSNKKQFLENYYGCKQAENYFLKAFETTKDTTLAAICIHKANLCNQNLQTLNWRLNNVYNTKAYDWKYELKLMPSKYKNLFVNRFKDIDFYMDYISNCYYGAHVNSYYY